MEGKIREREGMGEMVFLASIDARSVGVLRVGGEVFTSGILYEMGMELRKQEVLLMRIDGDVRREIII